MLCQLCLKNFKKLAEAHIIPRAFYRTFQKNDKNQFYRITKEQKKIPMQNGIWDNSILCAKCDNLIGKFDGYARSLFHNPKREHIKITKATQTDYLYSNIDYIQFKLFIVSLFWRMSITNRKEYKNVKLGKKIEDTIRKMILENDPKKQLDFPSMIITFPKLEAFKEINYIKEPSQHRLTPYNIPIAHKQKKLHGTTIFYICVINAYKIWFFPSKINNMEYKKLLQESSLNETGKMKIHTYTKGDYTTEIKNIYNI